MKTQKKIFALILLICFPVSIHAQVEGHEDLIRLRAAEKVGQMNDYIKNMADKSQTMNYRNRRKTKALNLYVGKGYEYVEDGVRKEGVQMQVTSKNKAKIGQPLIRRYFDNLVGQKLDRIYTNVKIEATEVADIKVSSLRKVDDNLWECTCVYDQAFEGWRDGRPIYRDITTKRIKCYVIAEQTEDDGWEFIILLGDVYAIKTK